MRAICASGSRFEMFSFASKRVFFPVCFCYYFSLFLPIYFPIYVTVILCSLINQKHTQFDRGREQVRCMVNFFIISQFRKQPRNIHKENSGKLLGNLNGRLKFKKHRMRFSTSFYRNKYLRVQVCVSVCMGVCLCVCVCVFTQANQGIELLIWK